MHLLHVVIDRGLSIELSCPHEDAGDVCPSKTYYDGTPVDECWVVHHAAEAVNEWDPWDVFDAISVGRVTGPIPVWVWNDGAEDECSPVIELWEDDRG